MNLSCNDSVCEQNNKLLKKNTDETGKKHNNIVDRLKEEINFMREQVETTECKIENRAILETFINFSVRDNIVLTSQIAWINRNQLILTINNAYNLINLKHTDLLKTKNRIMYGIQQMNMGLFCTLVKKIYKKERNHVCLSKTREIEIEEMNQTKNQKTVSRMMISS